MTERERKYDYRNPTHTHLLKIATNTQFHPKPDKEKKKKRKLWNGSIGRAEVEQVKVKGIDKSEHLWFYFLLPGINEQIHE